MRREGSESFEREASKCNAMKDLRRAADRCPDFKGEALDSVEPVKILLTQVFERLQLKERNIKCSPPAANEDMVDMWNNLKLIESDWRSRLTEDKVCCVTKEVTVRVHGPLLP
jgi:hypothetical protein